MATHSVYEPAPLGLTPAREAVAQYYADKGIDVSANQVVLTASTSESYSLLFKLLLNPNDAVLLPRPSYPLFDFLAQLDAVRPIPYGAMDSASLEAGLTSGARVALTVHPNNPTGQFVNSDVRNSLLDALAERKGALLADEVFYDYCWMDDRPPSFAGCRDVLCFVLSGLSKVCGLPGHKCGWIVVGGPHGLRDEALARLECMCDTYLSVNTAVQHALPSLLAGREPFQQNLKARIRSNWETLQAHVPGVESRQGGWSAVIRLDPGCDDEGVAIQLLEQFGVVVHPGYLFDFPTHDRLVLNLIAPTEIFTKGVHCVASAL
jgi:hypothetical protein